MSTKKQIVYNILNILEAGRIHDDFVPSYYQLSYIIDYKRAKYIRQDQTKNYFDTDQFYQDLGVINMVKVDKAECTQLSLDCDVLRSEVPIPNVMRLNFRLGLKISAIDKQTRFTIVLPERSPFLGNTKFPQLGVKIYWLNGYLYIPESCDIRAINVRGLLENPKAASTFVCNGESCYTDDSNYPLTSDLEDLIVKDILSNELRGLMTIVPDEENDGNDNNTR